MCGHLLPMSVLLLISFAIWGKVQALVPDVLRERCLRLVCFVAEAFLVVLISKLEWGFRATDLLSSTSIGVLYCSLVNNFTTEALIGYMT